MFQLNMATVNAHDCIICKQGIIFYSDWLDRLKTLMYAFLNNSVGEKCYVRKRSNSVSYRSKIT